jgi:hypothetical protein
MDDPRLDTEKDARLNAIALAVSQDLEDPFETVEGLVVMLTMRRHAIARWAAVLESQ